MSLVSLLTLSSLLSLCRYIPRLFFVNADGEPLDVYNEDGNPSYKYFYSSAAAVEAQLNRQAEKLSN